MTTNLAMTSAVPSSTVADAMPGHWLALVQLDPLLGWIAAAALATLFAHAALIKLLDRPLFEQHLAAYRVGQGTGLLAWLVPAAEALTAALLLSPARGFGAALAAVLLLGYAGVMAWHRAQGRDLDCGCGGEPMSVSWALVLRNLLLTLVAVLAWQPVSARAMGWADFGVVVGATLLATLLYAASHQILRQLDRLKPRSAAGLFRAAAPMQARSVSRQPTSQH